MAPNTNDMKMLRVVVREDFSKARCDALIQDIKLCIGILDNMEKAEIKKNEDASKKHVVNSWKSFHNHNHYKNEKHSLQGKTGKTHAVC